VEAKNEWNCTSTIFFGIFGKLCLFGRGGGMKELAAGLNPVFRNRTVHSTLLSAEIQGTLVKNFVSSTKRVRSNTHLSEAGCFHCRRGK